MTAARRPAENAAPALFEANGVKDPIEYFK